MIAVRENLRIGWMSHHVEGVKPLQDLLGAKCPIECIITLEPDLLEKRSGAADFSGIAKKHGLKIHRIRNINDCNSIDLLSRLSLDVLL